MTVSMWKSLIKILWFHLAHLGPHWHCTHLLNPSHHSNLFQHCHTLSSLIHYSTHTTSLHQTSSSCLLALVQSVTLGVVCGTVCMSLCLALHAVSVLGIWDRSLGFFWLDFPISDISCCYTEWYQPSCCVDSQFSGWHPGHNVYGRTWCAPLSSCIQLALAVHVTA